MIADLTEDLPASLVPFCAAMSIGAAAESGRPVDGFDETLNAFAAAHAEAPRDAVVSLWSMYYFAALIVPAAAALLLRDIVLPVALDEIAMVCDAGGLPRFVLAHDGRPATTGRRFATLVDGHLAPFAALCARHSGASPRLFWSNAAVVLDWALGEIDPRAAMPAARREALALLDGSGGACRLAHALRRNADGTSTRRVCCLRYRLPGVGDCTGLCPRHR